MKTGTITPQPKETAKNLGQMLHKIKMKLWFNITGMSLRLLYPSPHKQVGECSIHGFKIPNRGFVTASELSHWWFPLTFKHLLWTNLAPVWYTYLVPNFTRFGKQTRDCWLQSQLNHFVLNHKLKLQIFFLITWKVRVWGRWSMAPTRGKGMHMP